MAPRRRTYKNRDLPDNLYPTSHGYEYKHPITGKRHGVGSDRALAIRRAKILNQELMPSDTLVTKILGRATVSQVLVRFRQEYLDEKKYAERTRSETEYRLARYDREFGEDAWESITLKRLSDWLAKLTRAAYIKHRSQWCDIFRFTCAVGLSERNIAELTLRKEPLERKRKRWSDETYQATYNAAEPWLQLAMRLSTANSNACSSLSAICSKPRSTA